MKKGQQEFIRRAGKESLGDTLLTSLLFVISLFMVFSRLFLVTPYDVSGESMMPTLEDGDRLIMKDRVSLEKGDIVVLDSPSDDEDMYIKRVIALGGDEVAVREGRVFVNGEQLQEDSYSLGDTLTYEFTEESRELEMVVPKGEVFVLGDNRGNSMDSRVFGTVKEDSIRGEYWCRVLPLSRIGCD